MCGIIGFNWKDEKLADGLNDSLTHRGPDQKGVYCDDKVSVAHRRLSILDLSEAGIQPMLSEDGKVIIVFNGEIFNYKELKGGLEGKGHVFKSHTDTEVLVHMYEEYGPEMLGELNGQFSFCIYDKEKGEFFLARDRVGILPLFYYNLDGRFMFSSELKVILRSGINAQINEEALALYLRFGYIAAPYCILKNAFKLKPAHYLVYDLEAKKIKTYERYWDISFKDNKEDPKRLVRTIRSALEEAVQKRLMSDVPVGAFLSGGIDSSAVVALIKKYKKDLKTFSIKFDYPEFDESAFARRASGYFKTDHHEIFFSSQDVRKIIPKLVTHFDEPFGDSSAIPTYLVSKIARQHVTVCLSGDGGDELLGGYNRYRYFSVLRKLNNLPRTVKRILIKALGLCARIYPKFELDRVKELLTFGRLNDIELFERLSEKIDRDDLEKLLKKSVDFKSTFSGIKTGQGLNCLQHYDIVNYLEGDILAKVDRASMASSLESRPPFLDHNFMEICFGINSRLRIKGSSGKWILKKALEGIVPAEIIRRKKKGFGVPIKHYLKNELKDLVEKYVFNYAGHDLFDNGFLKGMSSRDKLKDSTRLYWNVMMFNMWHEKWMV